MYLQSWVKKFIKYWNKKTKKKTPITLLEAVKVGEFLRD